MELLTVVYVVAAVWTGDLKLGLLIAMVAGFSMAALVVFRSQVELVNPFKSTRKSARRK